MSQQSNSDRQNWGLFGSRYDTFEENAEKILNTPYVRWLDSCYGTTGNENQNPSAEHLQADQQPEQPVANRPEYSHNDAGNGYGSATSTYQSPSTAPSGPNTGNPRLTREPKVRAGGAQPYLEAEFDGYRYWSYDGFRWELNQHQANTAQCPPIIRQQLETSDTNSVEPEPSQSYGGSSTPNEGHTNAFPEKLPIELYSKLSRVASRSGPADLLVTSESLRALCKQIICMARST